MYQEDTGAADPNSIPQDELEKVNRRRTQVWWTQMRLMKRLVDEVHYEIEPDRKIEYV